MVAFNSISNTLDIFFLYPITIGIDNKSDYMAKDINNSTFVVENNKITSPINNTAFIYNSLVAYVVGKLCNIAIPNIQKGIKTNEFTSN